MKTIIIVMFIILSCSVVADNVSIEISTSQDIDSIIALESEGDISTDIYCNGDTCSTNVYGGNIQLPRNQTFIYNRFSSSSHSGLNINDFVTNLFYSVNDYNTNAKMENSWYDLFSVLDQVFVSHREFQSTYDNTQYLADEIDKLKAENKLLKDKMDVKFDDKALECQTAVFKSQRFNHQIITESGMVADYKEFGNDCVRLD